MCCKQPGLSNGALNERSYEGERVANCVTVHPANTVTKTLGLSSGLVRAYYGLRHGLIKATSDPTGINLILF